MCVRARGIERVLQSFPIKHHALVYNTHTLASKHTNIHLSSCLTLVSNPVRDLLMPDGRWPMQAQPQSLHESCHTPLANQANPLMIG